MNRQLNNYFYDFLILNLKNLVGRSIKRKIIVIDCDDWGGIRIPSRYVYEKLLKKGLFITRSRYKFDTLESKQDLEMLFDALCSVKDRNGCHAIITAVTNVANPDFEKIKESGFSEYYYEKFTDTLYKYYPGENVYETWREGIDKGLFFPELHGRDHLTVQLWLKTLREGNYKLRSAFENGIVSIDLPFIPKPAREFRAEFFFTSNDQKHFLVDSIKDGIKLFKEIFGYIPHIFVPSNNIFHPEFEKVVSEEGVKFLYSSRKMPYPSGDGGLKYRYIIRSQNYSTGIRYYFRNCAFEPTDENYKGIDLTIKQIAAAFRWGKPAIISTHRANFTGSVEPKNREKGLRELRKLLKEILKLWPDAEFMDTSSALKLIYYHE